MKLYISFIISVLLLSFSVKINACTSAIFTGKATPDGRPLMWKHRDSGEENNRIEYFSGLKYNFYALVNSPIKYNDNKRIYEAWSGANNVGFCIMNTASYNLKNDNVPTELMDREGIIMFEALGVCKNLKDFENFLDKHKRPIGVEANFGVIDAEGGAAYYEVNNDSWKKVDVTDSLVAPQGYLVYTNFSFSGRKDEGFGYIRYNAAEKLIKDRITNNGDITSKWIMQGLSRSFYHSLLGVDLYNEPNIIDKFNGWFIDQDFIPRKSSTASIVFQGVLKGENTLNTVMWTLLGYPPAGITVPLILGLGSNLPEFMIKSSDSDNSLLCDWALKRKKSIFSIKRGSGSKYINFYNLKKCIDESIQIENKIFNISLQYIEKIRRSETEYNVLLPVYEYIEEIVKL